jgi:hypothetical protein
MEGRQRGAQSIKRRTQHARPSPRMSAWTNKMFIKQDEVDLDEQFQMIG